VGTLKLPPSGEVYLDASAVIFSVEKIEPYWTILQPLWQAAKTEQFSLISSQLLLLEVLVKPLQSGDVVLETTFRNLLLHSQEFHLLPINLTVLDTATRLRATAGLKTPDAIHAATALTAGCTLFVTNDDDFKRVPGLPVAILHEIVRSTP
jgi:predicted nucleic acid-binding protein